MLRKKTLAGDVGYGSPLAGINRGPAKIIYDVGFNWREKEQRHKKQEECKQARKKSPQ